MIIRNLLQPSASIPMFILFYLMWRTSIRLSLALSTLILYFISLNSHLQDDFLILDL